VVQVLEAAEQQGNHEVVVHTWEAMRDTLVQPSPDCVAAYLRSLVANVRPGLPPTFC
jgi:hypothetical protein